VKLSRFAWSFTLFSVYWYIGCLQQYVRNVALKVSRYFRVRTLTRSVQHWSLSFHITSFQNRLYSWLPRSDLCHLRVVYSWYCASVCFRVMIILVSRSRPSTWHELIVSKRRQKQLLHDMDNWGDSSIALFVSRFNCIKKGWARTQTPTTRNCTVELPTFAVIAGVSPVRVQWKSLALEETPPWSDLLPRQVSMTLYGECTNARAGLFNTTSGCQCGW